MLNARLAMQWRKVAIDYLPFADVATAEVPMSRLLRLSLFQVSAGMAVVLLNGTLNRVMIVELGLPAWLVAAMVSLPLLSAPLRVFVGFRSDTHRSAFGWRRVPYIWFGTLMQFGGFAIMPFALIILSGDTQGPAWLGPVAAALAFLLAGAGMHTAQTAGLALATDLTAPDKRPRVVAQLYVMLLLGTCASALLFGALLADFSQIRLIRVLQGVALITIALNLVALWKQEGRDPGRHSAGPRPPFVALWRQVAGRSRFRRFLLGVSCGTVAFSMQDILLEPYGAQVLGLSVGATTMLTAVVAGGALSAFLLSARWLHRGADPRRLAAHGVLLGVGAFAVVIFAGALDAAMPFYFGSALLGCGSGMFALGMLVAAMDFEHEGCAGLALGAWGAAQAFAAGAGVAIGGGMRDVVTHMAGANMLGPALTGANVGYAAVYHAEIVLLFVTLIIIGPLVRAGARMPVVQSQRFGLAELPH